MSALGGALSLYLGISIAMFFEVIEFLFDLCLNAYYYTAKGKRARPRTIVSSAISTRK